MQKIRKNFFNKKKITIVLIILLLVAISVFVIPVKNGRSLFGNIAYSKKVKAGVQPQNYDKMKIAYANIKKRTTGTTKFNTPNGSSVNDGSLTSDMLGNDVSELDDYVRTFDFITYTIEVGIERNEDTTSPDDTFKGGIIKVKAYIPENPDGLYYLGMVKENWISGYRLSDYNQTLTGYYVIPSNKSAVGGVQELSFTVITSGYLAELSPEYTPKFEIWMEGNKPDNSSSTADSIILSDEENINITGVPREKVDLLDGGINHQSELDGVRGNYINFAWKLNPEQGSLDSRKGSLIPTSDISGRLKIEYYYRIIGSSAWTKIQEDDPKATDIINGTRLVSYGVACEDTPGFWPTSYNNRGYSSNCGNYKSSSNSTFTTYNGYTISTFSERNSGDMTASQSGNIINFTNTNTVYNSQSIQPVVVDGFELFVPYYDDGGGNYEYQIKIIAEEVEFHDNYGREYVKSSNAFLNKKIINQLGGQFDLNLSGRSINGNVEDYNKDYLLIGMGNKAEFMIQSSTKEGTFEGGKDTLITFDTTALEARGNKVTDFYTINYVNSGSFETPSTDDIVTYYGVYKLNPDIGLNSDELVNNAVYEDFDWYETPVEALENGVISAFLFDEPQNKGNGITTYIYLRFFSKTDESAINYSGIIRQKVRYYKDVDKTEVYEIGYNQTYEKANIDSNGTVTAGSPMGIGHTYTISAYNMKTSISYDPYFYSGSPNRNFNVQEDTIKLYLRPSIIISSTIDDSVESSFKFTFEIPKELTYKNNSASITPDEITTNSNGTSTLSWTFNDWPVNEPLPIISLSVDMSRYIANNSSKYFNTNLIDLNNPLLKSDNGNALATFTNLAGSSLKKSIDMEFIDKNNQFNVTDYIYNISQSVLMNVKTYEILPKNNDEFGSSFSGTYTYIINDIDDDQRLFYTTVDPDTIEYTLDSLGNKTIQDIDLINDSRFIEVQVGDTIPFEATMLASYIDEINSMSDKSFSYSIKTNGNQFGDKYCYVMNASSSTLANSIHTEKSTVTVVDRKITGIAFEDVNRDDVYDANNDLLLSNIVVKLLDNNKNIIDETTTNSSGYYQFEHLENSSYYVRFENKSGYEIIEKGSHDNSSKVNTNFETDEIEHTSNPYQEVMEIDNINFGIRKKAATLTINYYLKGTTTPLSDTVTSTVYYTDTYTATPATDIPTKYRQYNTAGDPVTGTVDKDNIVVTFYYELKPSTLTIRYVDEDGNDIDPEENIVDPNKHYDDEYSSTQKTFTNYTYVGLDPNSDAVSGIIDKDNVTVIYVYHLKEATLTVKYVDEQGNDIDASENIINQEKHWGDQYSTTQKTFTNYSYVGLGTGSDPVEGTISKDAVVVTYVYHLKEATLIVKYVDDEGNNIDANENINDNTKHWGDSYTTTQKTFTNYRYVGLDNDSADAEGTIAADTVTVIYVYTLKEATVTAYYLDEQDNIISPTVEQPKHWGDPYSTEQKTLTNYTYLGLAEGSDPASGTVNKDSINVTYRYHLKEATLIVKYVDDEGNNIDANENINDNTKHWGDSYTTTQKPFANYDFVEQTGDDAEGTIAADTVTVTYVYTLKSSTVLVHHYYKDSEDRVFADESYPKKYTQSYSVSPKDTTNTNYNYVSKAGDEESGTVNKDNYVITYYYEFKKGTVTTHHYLYDNGETTTKLAEDDTDVYDYTSTYTTKVSDEVPNNYEFHSKTDNYTGPVDRPSIVVSYYYQLKDSTLTTSIDLSSSDEITSPDQEVDYTITYNATVTDYIGDATITIVNHLPYTIDPDNSDLDGGTYNPTNNTITWTIPWEDIDSYEGTNEEATIEITKNITVVFTNLDPTERIIINNVEGIIELDNNERSVEDSEDIEVNIPSTIIIKYVDEDGNILETKEEQGIVGETLITTPIEKEGFKLVESPNNEEIEYTIETQTVIYKYERIYYVIETESSEGGQVAGREKVNYGDDSTKDLIVVTANKGYVIDKIYVDGVEYPIEPNQTEVVIENFTNVKEDHLVTATFKVINPVTTTAFKLGIIVMFFVSMFMLIKIKTLKIKRYN